MCQLCDPTHIKSRARDTTVRVHRAEERVSELDSVSHTLLLIVVLLTVELPHPTPPLCGGVTRPSA